MRKSKKIVLLLALSLASLPLTACGDEAPDVPQVEQTAEQPAEQSTEQTTQEEQTAEQSVEQTAPEEQQTEESEQPTEQSEEVVYGNTDMVSMLIKDLTLDSSETLKDLKVTGKYLGPLSVYAKQIDDKIHFFVVEGDKLRELEVNEKKGSIYLKQSMDFQRESSYVVDRLMVDEEAQAYKLSKSSDDLVEHATAYWEGEPIEGLIFTNPNDGSYWLDFDVLKDFLHLEQLDSEIYRFEKDTTPEGIIVGNSSAKISWLIVPDSQFVRYSSKTVQQSKINKNAAAVQEGKMYIEEALGTNKESSHMEGDKLYLPLSYLESVFGIDYSVDCLEITLESGAIIPRKIPLEHKNKVKMNEFNPHLVGLYGRFAKITKKNILEDAVPLNFTAEDIKALEESSYLDEEEEEEEPSILDLDEEYID